MWTPDWTKIGKNYQKNMHLRAAANFDRNRNVEVKKYYEKYIVINFLIFQYFKIY